ncbi:YciI family protein [Paenibacillus glycinis]|uniref:YciI family protein n=1 Tax=Paenibacillus glycinis TaxID=2697035 RepID=A0ABW9XNM9_9BACL|nr:YciI family protein [Paenibacillus glycinis]NBD24242.1 YciI family protein [Paenibacillus glycinis]
MRFMLVVKATGHSEAGLEPGSGWCRAMAAYRDALAGAGALVAEARLLPSASGVRIAYPVPGGAPVVTAGPFARETEPMAGYLLIDARSQEEAMAWAMRMPDPSGHGEGVIEVRELAEGEQGSSLRDWKAMAMEAELLDQMEMLKRNKNFC